MLFGEMAYGGADDDVAILRATAIEGAVSRAETADYDRAAVQEFSDGEQLYLLNLNRDLCQGELVYKKVDIKDFGKNLMYVIAEHKAGMSGDGIYSSEGKYIGMIIGGTENGVDTVCLPAERVIRFYSQLDL